MASFKELSLSRPLPQSSQRHHHSHSMSLGAVNPNHRVTRRKSVTTAAVTSTAAAAVAAATVKDPSGGDSAGVPMPASVNRRPSSRKPPMESSSVGVPSGFTAATSSPSFFSRSMNSPGYQDPSVAGKLSVPNQSPLAPNTGSAATNTRPNPSNLSASSSSKNRSRGVSEGAPPTREGKRSLVELRCERCGKGYKHGSCLSKHMWEHDPAWAVTSKLLISKHQQVQLLEAASVLVTMNDGPEESELSSASPDASSERREGLSSADTTPPPMEQDMEENEESEDDEDDLEMSGVSTTADKRYDVPRASRNPSGLFSHSYQSIPSSSFNGSAPLHSPSFANFRHSSIETRPSTANTRLHDDDEADLAAAIGLCNFGTPRTRPVAMSPSIPPVPSLPGRFLDPSNQSQSLDQSRVPAADTAIPGSIPGSIPNFLSVSYNPSLSYKVSDEREVRTGDTDRTSRQNRNADVDFGNRPTQDDDDDGVFGLMEE